MTSAVDLLAKALHDAGVRCDPNIVACRATHKGHAKRILDALPVEKRDDGREGHWRLTLWWEAVPRPLVLLEDG